MSKKLKVGIIGTGAIGAVHAKSYQAAGGVEIAAICDVHADLLKQRGKEFGVKQCFSDYHKLLETDVDAVSVCVGNVLHHEVATAALQAGKHILLEKPMAMNATEAADIVQAADKAGKVVQIGMVNRQRADSQVLRGYIEAGQLGEIYHMRCVLIRRRGIPGLGGWFTTKAESGGGPLIDLGVHWFDMAMWLSDHWNPTAVSAMNYAKFGRDMASYTYVNMWAGPPKLDGTCDVEDYSTGLVRFADKATLGFEIAWAANTFDQSYVEILGDKGGARIFGDEPLTIYTEHQGRLADIQPKFSDKTNRFDVQATKFLAACRGEQPPAATAEQGLVTMKLIDAIYESGEKGQEIKLDA